MIEIDQNKQTQLQVIDTHLESNKIKPNSNSFNFKLQYLFDDKLSNLMIKAGNSVKLRDLYLSSTYTNNIIKLDERYMKGVVKLCDSTLGKVYFTGIDLN